jgi:hypothetical protein
MGISRAGDEEGGAAKTSALGILGLKLSYDMSLDACLGFNFFDKKVWIVKN